MVGAVGGCFSVMTMSPVLSYRLASIGLVLLLAVGLSACGRKGPLDAPPGGLSAATPEAGDGEEASTDQGGDEINYRGRRRRSNLPIIRGPDKKIPLDVLID